VRYDPATNLQRTIASNAIGPAVSPDGQRIAYLAAGRITIDSNGERTALDVPGPVRDLAWWPYGSRLVYSAQSQIYATASVGGPATQLTRGPGDHYQPAVSPDARSLAYTLHRAGVEQIVVEDLVTGVARQLTEGNCHSHSPAWLPDSRGLIFASDCERGLGLPALFRASKLN
jgi:Tol biopolymer transport system component